MLCGILLFMTEPCAFYPLDHVHVYSDLVVLDCTAIAADAAVTATNAAIADCLLLAPHPTRYISRFWTRFSYSL